MSELAVTTRDTRGQVIFKMSGSGNDFVFVDARATPVAWWTAERIRAVCARGTGVGADGLIAIEPGTPPTGVRFHFFNNDGRRAEMCGNGALCATRLAVWLELAPPDGLILETDSGPVQARCVEGEGHLAEITLPAPTPVTEPDIALDPGERGLWFTTVGVPHAVVLVDQLAAVALERRGRALRSHPAIGPAGANVNFVANGGSSWAIRTYERGVEAETLACGTGAAASAIALAGAGHTELPWAVATASGRTLRVSGQAGADGRFSKLRLVGEGRLVFRAVL